ncbi:hypothetical protein BDP27DRAFT_1406603 [Rhodocollybia butyracea]|uniref:Uncharacterized protein n=1 Tax=Rhodocollybia butyracea TaxID=206335 RepID=A0A9P5PD27_9AGAR|nr:hypothetical protein BDP27DRAFT_1406603 [Rhodocollybia butyracea]
MASTPKRSAPILLKNSNASPTRSMTMSSGRSSPKPSLSLSGKVYKAIMDSEAICNFLFWEFGSRMKQRKDKDKGRKKKAWILPGDNLEQLLMWKMFGESLTLNMNSENLPEEIESWAGPDKGVGLDKGLDKGNKFTNHFFQMYASTINVRIQILLCRFKLMEQSGIIGG